jgi:hypothetical protein
MHLILNSQLLRTKQYKQEYFLASLEIPWTGIPILPVETRVQKLSADENLSIDKYVSLGGSGL